MNSEGNLWLSKRRILILFIAMVMIVVLGVAFLNTFREEKNNTDDGNDSMYNSYRFFFRLYYPDDWDVKDDDNKFMLDKEQSLVLELFPLKEKSDNISSESGLPTSSTPNVISSPEASATIDPKAGMERDESFTMSFYYKEYDDIRDDLEALAEAEKEEQGQEQGGSVNIQDASAKPTDAPIDKAPASNEILASYIFDKFIESKEAEEYTFYAPRIFDGKTISFMVLPFEYTENEKNMQGELYIASRGMAYYEILVEATKDSYAKNEDAKNGIIYDMKFSVFEY